MEVSGRRAVGSEEVARVCDTCMRKRSASHAAFGYCIECREFLCQDCYDVHRDPAPSSNHNLLEGKHMPKEKLPSVDMCNTHTDEKILYLCKTHSALACQKCAFLTHRMCTDVCDISTLSNEYELSKRRKELTKAIVELETEVDKIRQARMQNLLNVDTTIHQAKAEVLKVCEEVREHLCMLEQSMNETIDDIGAANVRVMDRILHECDLVGVYLKIVTTELDTSQNPIKKGNLFIATEKAGVTLQRLGDKLKALNKHNTVRELVFEADVYLNGFAENVKQLDKLYIRDETKQYSQLVSDKPKVHRRADPVNVEIIDDINARTQSDQNSCRITGCTLLAGESTLAVTDESNSSVKLLDLGQKCAISQIHVQSWPWDITPVESDQLAVTLPQSRKIQFLYISKEALLSVGKKIKVSGECFGIAYSHNRLFVSFTNPGQVQILKLSGNIVSKFSNKTDGLIDFISPCSLTLSTDLSRLYVSDSVTNTIYCLDVNSGTTTKHKYPDLACPYGMAAFDEHSVVVCGSGSHKLCVITESGNCKVVVGQSHGVKYPKCVSYSRARSTMYIGQETDSVKIVKLSYAT